MILVMATRFVIILFFFLFSACNDSINVIELEDDPEEETYFNPGEYGGSSLEDKEDIYNVTFSNDGERVALIRRRTPGNLTEPIRQLWIVDKDGRNPEFIASGTQSIAWSEDDSRIASTFVIGGQHTFVIVIDLEKRIAKQLTGSPDHTINRYNAANPQFMPGSSNLLVSVWGQAYQQDYDIGVYVINYEDESVEGPLGEYLNRANLGNNGAFFSAFYLDTVSGDYSNIFVNYDFSTGGLDEINPELTGTEFRLDNSTPNPRGNEIILEIRRDFADQLVKTSFSLEHFEQITELGGHNVKWMPDGNFVFIRDIHKGSGAHYVPHKYNSTTGTITKLWDDLPDYVPEFPPTNNFTPIDITIDW